MSSILTIAGRKALTQYLQARTLFVALGSGLAGWSSITTDTYDMTDGALALPVQFVDTVTVKSEDGDTTYVLGTDYTVDGVNGVINRTISGDIGANDTLLVSYRQAPPPADPTATGLHSYLGWKRVLVKQFVVPDPDGSIQVTTGRYSLSPDNAPTNRLYLETYLLQTELPTAVIKEYGFFTDTVINTGLPSGQQFFANNQITTRGNLLIVSNVEKMVRTPISQEKFAVVVSL